MKIKNYSLYIFENHLDQTEDNSLIDDLEILETISIDSDKLVSDVDTKRVEFHEYPFNFDIGKFSNDYTLEQLRDNPDFNDNLSKHELFISELNNTKDYDTFVSDTIKYILIHKRLDRSMSKLEKLGDPLYVIFQIKSLDGDWVKDNIKIYKINGDFSNFYKKLSSKTIELNKGDKKYIYVSNGERWLLRNIQNKNDEFKEIMSNSDIKNLLKDSDISISIIS